MSDMFLGPNDEGLIQELCAEINRVADDPSRVMTSKQQEAISISKVPDITQDTDDAGLEADLTTIASNSELSDEEKNQAMVVKFSDYASKRSHNTADKAYFRSNSDSAPISGKELLRGISTADEAQRLFETVDEGFHKVSQELIEDVLKEARANDIFRDKQIFTRQEELQKKPPRYLTSFIDISINDEPKSISTRKEEPDWVNKFNNSVKADKGYNLEMLKNLFTQDILNRVGGVSRVKSIYVEAQALYINDFLYIPDFSKNPIDMSTLPDDVVSLVEGGCFAEFFNWKSLLKCNNIYSLYFDSADWCFYRIGADIPKVGRKLGFDTFFSLCPSLVELTIGSETYNKNNADAETEAAIKMKFAKCRRQSDLDDSCSTRFWGGWHPEIGNKIDATNSALWNSTKDYWKNRGDKGFWRYTGGVLARASLTGVASILNLGWHFGSGIIKTAKQAMKEATTPLSTEDF